MLDPGLGEGALMTTALQTPKGLGPKILSNVDFGLAVKKAESMAQKNSY